MLCTQHQQLGVAQYVAIRVITAFVTLILTALDKYEMGSYYIGNWHVWDVIINSASQAWAM